MEKNNKSIAQAREKKLTNIRKQLEKKFSVREATITIGHLLQGKIGYLPSFSQKEQSLIKRIVATHGWHTILEALEFALTKPELYFYYYGREVISFMSFYHNLPYILQNLPQEPTLPPLSLEHPPEEEVHLSPFMKGVLEKMKDILHKKE